MPEFLYLGQFKGVEECHRISRGKDTGADVKRHITDIPKTANAMGLKKERFLAKRGDVLIWSADLAHGGSPISVDRTRKSVVTHYCPAEAVPSYFEFRAKKRVCHNGIAYYSSAHYDCEPRQP